MKEGESETIIPTQFKPVKIVPNSNPPVGRFNPEKTGKKLLPKH